MSDGRNPAYEPGERIISVHELKKGSQILVPETGQRLLVTDVREGKKTGVWTVDVESMAVNKAVTGPDQPPDAAPPAPE